MGSEVFAAYETEINIAELKSKTESFSLTGTSQYTIDNKDNKKVYPLIKITADGSVTLNSVTNNSGQTFNLNSLSLADTDTVTLNFQKQEYTYNSNSLISDVSFDDNELLHLTANEENTIEINLTGTIDVEITYDDYQDNNIFNYVRNFSIDVRNNFKKTKPFNGNKTTYKKKTESNYEFSIGKLSVDWGLYDRVDSEKEFKITYYEYNEDNFEEYKRFLVGVTFDDYNKSFDEADGLLIQNCSGDAFDILKKEYS